MIDLNRKIDRALRYIDSFAPKTEPYYVCYKEVFKWWVGEDPNQITMEDYMNTIDEEW